MSKTDTWMEILKGSLIWLLPTLTIILAGLKAWKDYLKTKIDIAAQKGPDQAIKRIDQRLDDFEAQINGIVLQLKSVPELSRAVTDLQKAFMDEIKDQMKALRGIK